MFVSRLVRRRQSVAALLPALLLLLGTSATAHAADDALAAPDGAKRELSGKRTSRSTTWELASGEHVTRIAAGPVRWQDRDGAWHAYDETLTPRGDRFVGHAGAVAVTLPQQLADGAAIADGDDRLVLTLKGAAVTGVPDGDALVYAGARPGVDLKAQVVPKASRRR